MFSAEPSRLGVFVAKYVDMHRVMYAKKKVWIRVPATILHILLSRVSQH